MEFSRLAICFFLFFYIGEVNSQVTENRLIEDARARRVQRREQRELALLGLGKAKGIRYPMRYPSQTTTRPVKATNQQDKKSLEDFYRSTNGDHWSNSSGWMKGDPCKDGWLGIYCSQEGRVLGISLVYNQLSGALPSSIADLTSLETLYLYSNAIGGTIPAGLFSLPSLQTLDMNNNAFTGSLPSSISSKTLVIINLYTNKIQGQIPEGWDAPVLQTLSLSSNMLTGQLPASIGKLTNLTSLVLSRNLLTGTFPQEYSQLSKLQMLWLFDNNFNEPKIPDSWSRLTKLADVELDGLAGEFPSWMGSSWNKLFNLVIVDGHLTGSFPTSLCSLKQIQYLHLFNNSLSGPLPDCICNLPRTLNSLELSDNGFSGSIPECVGKLTNLTDFYLSRNNLSGQLPRSLGDIHYLNIIDFSSNSLVGSVPSTYTGLIDGTYEFTLCFNKLSSFEQGSEKFFDFIKGYTCILYENPWNCPIPSFVPRSCSANCSKCNTGSKQTSCSACTADSSCGWCSEGPNCLDGTRTGPDAVYKCGTSNWHYGTSSC